MEDSTLTIVLRKALDIELLAILTADMEAFKNAREIKAA